VTINEQIRMIKKSTLKLSSPRHYSYAQMRAADWVTFEELLYRKVSFADVNRSDLRTFGNRAEPRPHKAR